MKPRLKRYKHRHCFICGKELPYVDDMVRVRIQRHEDVGMTESNEQWTTETRYYGNCCWTEREPMGFRRME